MPPESCHGCACLKSLRPTASSASSAARLRSAFGTRFAESGSVTLPQTVIHGSSERLYSWKTSESESGGPSTTRPSTAAVPDDGASSPDRHFSSVVLPHPEG